LKRHRTLVLVLSVTLTATAVLVSAQLSEEPEPTGNGVSVTERFALPPEVQADRDISPVETPTRNRARSSGVATSQSRPPLDLPGTRPSGYELAEPGDRTPAPPPGFFRALSGALDGSRGTPMFVSQCSYSHSQTDDPLVYPRQPGASHLHDFFGNRQTDAYSTDDSLRDDGTTTCKNFQGDSAAYWVPALYQERSRVEPSYLDAYYTPGAKDHRVVEPFPRGLKILLKDDESSKWFCMGRDAGPAYEDPPTCPAGRHLALQLAFPDCWDGKYLDVPDHRAHMKYAMGYGCPKTHPVPVPQLVMFIGYLKAGSGHVDLAPLDDPSTPHADFINSWDQDMLTRFVRDCINAGTPCGTIAP
jgi:hypothetical protein